uniref:Putative ovule protein n=1 Tax=Solanum chacoense TaxID=4108 RepID=A0A0V0HE69_SOLCH
MHTAGVPAPQILAVSQLWANFFLCFSDLSCSDSSLLVPHPCDTTWVWVWEWDPCPIWSTNFGYFDQNRWGKSGQF